MLRWNTLTNAKNCFVADICDGENIGRFMIKRIPYLRKKPWQARFKGQLVINRNNVRTECCQNFIATPEEAKAICERWLNGQTTSSALSHFNAKREMEIQRHNAAGAEIVHKRDFHTHETIVIPPNTTVQIRRQREYVPEGFRRAAD